MLPNADIDMLLVGYILEWILLLHLPPVTASENCPNTFCSSTSANVSRSDVSPLGFRAFSILSSTVECRRVDDMNNDGEGDIVDVDLATLLEKFGDNNEIDVKALTEEVTSNVDTIEMNITQ